MTSNDREPKDTPCPAGGGQARPFPSETEGPSEGWQKSSGPRPDALRERPPSKGFDANKRTGQTKHCGKQHQPEPGTEEPDGHLDDQPQREDEYLSHVLKEFNPQRRDKKGPLPGASPGKEIRPGRTKDKS